MLRNTSSTNERSRRTLLLSNMNTLHTERVKCINRWREGKREQNLLNMTHGATQDNETRQGAGVSASVHTVLCQGLNVHLNVIFKPWASTGGSNPDLDPPAATCCRSPWATGRE